MFIMLGDCCIILTEIFISIWNCSITLNMSEFSGAKFMYHTFSSILLGICTMKGDFVCVCQWDWNFIPHLLFETCIDEPVVYPSSNFHGFMDAEGTIF